MWSAFLGIIKQNLMGLITSPNVMSQQKIERIKITNLQMKNEIRKLFGFLISQILLSHQMEYSFF